MIVVLHTLNFHFTTIIQVESTLDGDRPVEVKESKQKSEAGQGSGPESQDASDKVLFSCTVIASYANLKFITCLTLMFATCGLAIVDILWDGLWQN